MGLLSAFALMYVVILGGAIFGWLFPLKLKLARKHGLDKNNEYFRRLAREGDVDAKRLCSGSRKVYAFAMIGLALLTLPKFF